MARSFASGSQQALRGTAPITATPFTFSCFYYPTTSTSGILMGCYNSTVPTTQYFDLQSRGDGTLRIRHTDVDLQQVNTSATASLNAWHHAAYVHIANNNRWVYLDGGNGVQQTTSQDTPSGIDRIAIGEFSTSSPSTWFTGRIAEAAVWSAALGVDEIAALFRGVSPRRIRPLSLAGYWPLWGFQSPEIDLTANARSLTLVNTPPAANHAPVRPFSRGFWGSVPLIEVAAVAAVAPPPFHRSARWSAWR